MDNEELLKIIDNVNKQKITELELSYNHLAQLPPQIGQLKKLTELDLACNELKQLPPQIGLLTNLIKLDLGCNELKQLPPQIGLLTNLTELNLARNISMQLPPEIGLLANLAKVCLNNNKLTQMPCEIFKFTNLTELNLHSNELTELPSEIGLLTNLTTLRLYDNQLTELPSEIGLLTNLEILYLHNNQLTKLPSEIGLLKNLKILYLDNNLLAKLPPEIGKLTNLTVLRLSNNELTQLPPEIALLTKLEQNTGSSWDWGLNLKDNNFSLPDEVLKKDPQEMIEHILFASYRKGEIVNGEFLVSIGAQRDLKEKELAKIKEWLKIFRIKVFFMIHSDNRDIELSENSETALHQIKQFLTNKLLVKYREGQIVKDELFVSIGIQRDLKKEELAKIEKWLNLFRIKAFLGIDEEKPDLELCEDSDNALHQIKQYLSNKYQDHISQVYDQKTQAEK